MQFVSQLLNGLQLGSIYALVALGYTMVYGIIKLINFAHGDLIMVGSYVTLLLMRRANLPMAVASLGALVFCSVLGVLIERFAYRPLRKATRISALITAIAVSLLLQNLCIVLISPDPMFFTDPGLPMITIGNTSYSSMIFITIGVAAVCMILLQLFVKKTKMGKAMRAVSEDSDAAKLMGINVNMTISLTFAIGSALAAVAAVLYSMTYTQIEPMMGSMLGLKAFVAAVLGGIGIIPGAMWGGFAIGIVEALTKGYISTSLADAVVFGILILVLLLKPSGFMGKNVKEKV